MLVAGGDTGGTLGGFIPLSTSANSTTSSEIYNALTDVFSLVGPLVDSREATGTAVPLKVGGKTLIVGGSHCFAMSYGPAGTCAGTVFSGFQCDALNTAELYDESTSTFALAGSGSGGVMTTARSGATATLLADGTVLISGGSTGSSFLSTATPPPECGPSGQVAQNTAEIYNPATDTFTATAPIPGCPAGTQPPTTCMGAGTGLPAVCAGPSSVISTATESSTTVTITMMTANPTGLIVGDNVTVTGVSVAGYNGTFVVTAIPTSTTFQYMTTSGLAAGSGGVAAADTAQCGLVDSVASLLNDGTALVTGGDYITFLGQSSQQAFIFVPVYDGGPAWAQTNPMNVPRELPGIIKLPSGDVLVAGGLTGAAAACTGTPATPVSFTTNSSAEVYDPVAHTWTLTTGSSATPGAAGGMTTKRIASAELFTVGSKAGLAILAGGIDAETTNGSTPNFPACGTTLNIHQTTTAATDLFDPATTVFTATGVLTQPRGGYGVAILNPTAHFPDDLVVIGGECTNNASPSIASAPIGSATASGFCTHAGTPYYELYNQTSGLWTTDVGTGTVASTPANAPAYTLLP